MHPDPRGLRLPRRTFLELPALAALARLPAASAEGSLDFEAFAATCVERAKAKGSGREGEEALLLQLAEAGARLDPASLPKVTLERMPGLEPAVSSALVRRAAPVLISAWRLAPNATLPAHGHTPSLVLSLCLQGACRVEHYEVVGSAPPAGEAGAFQVRRTRAQLLRPGLSSSLTPDRDTIHAFRAGPAGALGLDVSVFVPGEGDWSRVAIGQRQEDPFEELFAARWTGKE